MNFHDVKVGQAVIETRNKYFPDTILKVVEKDYNDWTVKCTNGWDSRWKACANISLVSEPKIKLNILGYKRSGKDSAAEYWRDNFGMTFKSSSLAAAEIFIFDALMKKYDYESKEECYDDRMNRRDEWFNLICEYNKDDKTKLAREILNKTGAYVGMRSKEEVEACIKQNIFDLIIWIDAEERVGIEGSESCTVTKEYADIIITNNGTEAEFKEKLNKVGKIIFKKLD